MAEERPVNHAFTGALLRTRPLFIALTAALVLSLGAGFSPAGPAANAAPANAPTNASNTEGAKIEGRTLARKRKHRVSRGERVLRVVRRQNGDPYAWGAAGPHRFDCSGLTQFAYRVALGKRLPHSSRAQVGHTKRVSRKGARPGDLVFFHNRGGVYHVAVYAGGNRIWHAPGTGKRVTRATIWTRSHFYGRVR
ncbi:NlpC/P60 family protein [Nocardioides sp. zg-579]|uniref:NlpC/P60 family protein n=1 Tax=Nocardioides marmotae TaxID=2663857 RepID=A0A6I3IY56_9ACTN|nr:NlpC/P60 family protein [Gordonia jinghuaiqii]MTB93997.1 NlpC/P60 family protein [Nocardioides marmotae]